MEAREVIEQIQLTSGSKKSLTREIYIQLLPHLPRMPWKNLVYKKAPRPKARFTMWLELQGKLLTTNKLAKWGLPVDTCSSTIT